MRFRIGYTVFFLAVFAVSLVALMPISFVLDKAGLGKAGFQWDGASGSMSNTHLAGVRFGQQPIGDAKLRLKPGDFLKAQIGYEVEVTGNVGRFDGDVAFGWGRVAVKRLSGRTEVSQLVGLDEDLRRLGGTAQMNDVSVQFRDGACASASGGVSTDMLARLAETYDQGATDLAGAFACDGDMLALPMTGQTDFGDDVSARLRIGIAEASSLEAVVRTENPDIATLLVLEGFLAEGDTYRFFREAQIGPGGR